MKIASLLSIAGLTALAHGSKVARDYANNDYYVLHLDSSTAPDQISSRLGLTHEGQLGALDDHHVFRAPKVEHDIVKREIAERRRRKRVIGGSDPLDGILLSKKQLARKHLEKRIIPPRPGYWPVASLSNGHKTIDVAARDQAIQYQSTVMETLEIADPIFTEQWHLFNPIQLGHDVNVTGLWLDGITGKNVTVAVVDDGLDMNSDDLKPNYFAAGSWDFNDNDPIPAPELDDDRHGTRCAGEVAAARNDVCGVGVAYDSKVAGLRILSKLISDADEAEALMYKYDDNHIYSCSWGPSDDGQTMEAPDVVIRRAMLKAIQEGRHGLGSIYVFASGNGAGAGDNCNFDGYTNSIYSITVGAVDRTGQHPYYSEECSAQLVVTYSSGSGDAIEQHTTDVGKNNCYKAHGGTSAAAPLAAGIFALVLQVRPDLTWRDLQYLAMDTALPIEGDEGNQQDTSIGKKFSHTFGYGKIDSWALVEKAKDWKLVKPQAWFFSPWIHVKKRIPEGRNGLSVTFEVTKDMIKDANVARLEHVTVTMNVKHQRRGDLSVDLISPENVVSHLAVSRERDSKAEGYVDWTFMSVVHWGESGVGKWTIIVRDTEKNQFKGEFIDWRLKLWGEAIDADKATKLPMPDAHDDDDHDKIVETTTLPASTTSIPSPTGHPERPTKPASPSGTEEPSPSGTEEAPHETTTSSSSWISWLPGFGASKKAQIWIYGAIGLISAFCIGLGIYFWIARRHRLRNSSRDNYEFELLDDEEAEALNSGEKASGAKARRTRGGELYDAFAEGSDDEQFEDYRDNRDQSTDRLADDDTEHYAVGDDSDESDDEKGETRPLGGRR
ncbi:pheromone processing endoprotease [Fusarium piperis]|uniref:Pheromone processing endoprotease n=1 Tax=Fusarium piperis TaxID=1435070 RepID=A0A9W9BMQ1_9HYPO|nr:pheromone processing endoprotease [Fusarium piperis]